MNLYIRRYALTNARNGVGRTFVLTHEDAPQRVVAYYTLAAGSVSFDVMPEELRAGLPRYPAPVVLIAKFAVELSLQGQGLGTQLLIDAFEQVDRTAETVGVCAIRVDAIDERARAFYVKHGFLPTTDDAMTLVIGMKAVRDALSLPFR